jgi:hypothetical protein
MTHEEAVVRRCYAKLSYLTQQTIYSEAALEVEREWKAADPIATQALAVSSLITYQISDVKSGPLSEIANRAWVDVVDIPVNDTLLPLVQINGLNWNDRGEPFFWNTADVAWGKMQPSIPDDLRKVIAARTVATMLEMGGKMLTYPDVTYSRYATYNVVASYQGKTVGPYKAMFLFGKNKLGEVDAPTDLFANGGALFQANWDSFYPQYLNSHIRDITILHDWILSQQIECTSTSGVCCVNDHCGISQIEVSRAFATPLASKPRYGVSNPGDVK